MVITATNLTVYSTRLRHPMLQRRKPVYLGGVGSGTGPGMRCSSVLLLWAVSLRHAGASSLGVKLPPMIGTLKGAVCLNSALRQRG